MKKKENGTSSGTRVVKDLAPRREIKGGMLTSLIQTMHETRKSIVQNFRA